MNYKTSVNNKNKWHGVLIDYLYCEKPPFKHENIFGHAKKIKIEEDCEDDYYEVIIPSLDYLVLYITKRRILKFYE